MFIDIPTPEKILIIFNPISSVGNTRALAHRLGEFLVHHGKLVEVSESKKKMKAYMRGVSEISAYDLLVVVGGDGTVRKLLPLLSETKLPLYVVPGGNESLFAHSYGMSANTENLLKTLERSQCLEQFYGVISGSGIRGAKPFFIMASMGFDSLTVKRIGRRKGPINDFTYVWCGLSALASLHHPTVTITVDGQVVVDCQSGYIIVANSAAYARNLQLVPAANPSINELVMGFLPGARRYHELIKIWCMLQRKPAELPLQYVSGKSLSLTIHDLSYPMQVDGDYFRNRDIEAGATLEFEVSPKPIRVLIPPQR
ncbi:diacylglycerol kinase family protein [Nitrosomonas sp.]|uniref:diacylglycerol/lipid kinase family protein n=1 Tax=Nitrosomonas sp. TaxID=42353 RepID=UPI0026361B5A|nr:diacylglycerol kinase family protein [Nitrosomonas sp.]